MASYIANNQSRDNVTIMLSRAEAEALNDLAGSAFDDTGHKMNGQKRAAAQRALDALGASTNTSARRAGYFDT
ncbi:hypothetical protein [Roseibium alexandrii]|uniref:Uncharacterized protein n=1 Tax=Roseibium alexandrii TaxID=388408 RepID=A0A0M6ZWT6_9HYPH|nr:hypothetical protein [Roseibium alexandrii]CTQ67225.1 hypothetical protein LAX5112_01277 [Roseibium alexandrii]